MGEFFSCPSRKSCIFHFFFFPAGRLPPQSTWVKLHLTWVGVICLRWWIEGLSARHFGGGFVASRIFFWGGAGRGVLDVFAPQFFPSLRQYHLVVTYILKCKLICVSDYASCFS